MALDEETASPELVEARHKAAEEVCWYIVLGMALGYFNLPMHERKDFAKDFEKWTNLAVETGVMRSGDDDEEDPRSWLPQVGIYVWLNYPDARLPLGRIIDGPDDRGMVVIAPYREETKLFGKEYLPKRAMVINVYHLLPYPMYSPAYNAAFGAPSWL